MIDVMSVEKGAIMLMIATSISVEVVATHGPGKLIKKFSSN